MISRAWTQAELQPQGTSLAPPWPRVGAGAVQLDGAIAWTDRQGVATLVAPVRVAASGDFHVALRAGGGGLVDMGVIRVVNTLREAVPVQWSGKPRGAPLLVKTRAGALLHDSADRWSVGLPDLQVRLVAVWANCLLTLWQLCIGFCGMLGLFSWGQRQ